MFQVRPNILVVDYYFLVRPYILVVDYYFLVRSTILVVDHYFPHHLSCFLVFIYIQYIACLYSCFAVCLYPINVKTAEPIWPKFWLRPNMALRKVYVCSELHKIVSTFSIFVRFWKSTLKNCKSVIEKLK